MAGDSGFLQAAIKSTTLLCLALHKVLISFVMISVSCTVVEALRLAANIADSQLAADETVVPVVVFVVVVALVAPLEEAYEEELLEAELSICCCLSLFGMSTVCLEEEAEGIKWPWRVIDISLCNLYTFTATSPCQ